MGGRVERIFLRPSARTPMTEVEEVEALADVGLAGDHQSGGRRQVTLLAAAAWADACAEVGADVDPSARRANLVLSGVDLAETRGRRLRVGTIEIEIGGETTPCELLDAAQDGLCAALRPDWRGGAFGRLVTGGLIRVGDPVDWT